jgi:hypothetical protein
MILPLDCARLTLSVKKPTNLVGEGRAEVHLSTPSGDPSHRVQAVRKFGHICARLLQMVELNWARGAKICQPF